MAYERTAFDPQEYSTRYGPTLSALAGEQFVQGQDELSDSNQQGFDPDAEQNVRLANASNTSSAPLMSPLAVGRQLGRLGSPERSNLGGAQGGALSPQSSGAFYDPNGPHQSPPIYDQVDQLSDKQARALKDDHDTQLTAGKDQHGHTDMNDVWDKTYTNRLSERAEAAALDEQTASKALNPTWRDKLSMMLDAANRASAIRAQNPAMSKGDIWAVATRGALDGWMAHAQGQHDGYMKQQQAMRDQAGQDADAAVKRAHDTFGLQQKADQLLETKRHNLAEEARQADEAKTKAAEAKTKGTTEKAGTPFTLSAPYTDEGTGKTYPAGTSGYMRPDGSFVSKGAQGVKAGTKTTDTESQEKASSVWEKYLENYKKTEGSTLQAKLGKLSQDQIQTRAKAAFKEAHPTEYKVVFPDEPDISKPAPSLAAGKGSATPAWVKPKQ